MAESFDLSDYGIDDDHGDVHGAFKEWAEGNDMDVLEDHPHEGWTTAQFHEGETRREIRMDEWGNVELSETRHITSEFGGLRFTDKTMMMDDGTDGPDDHVRPGSFPLHKDTRR